MKNLQENPNMNKIEQEKDFFDNKIEVLIVSKEEFLTKMKEEHSDLSDEEILQAKGWNYDSGGKTIVLMRNDIFPEQYMPYLETHEKWEAYVARKDGFNLFKKSVREYKRDRNIFEFDDSSRKEFYGELSIYNYEFRHEYAIYKEYQQALKDGKLEEYHNWILKLRETELPKANEETREMISNDTEIRQSIYKKLIENEKHYFTRNS